MSSWLTQVTVVPTFTFRGVGAKVKLSMMISVSAAFAVRLPIAITMPAPSTRRSSRRRAMPPGYNVSIMARPSAGERRIDDGERRLCRHQVDVGDPEVLFQLTGRYHHRPRALRRAGRRLRERGGARGVERDVAFHLLQHLVDVAVQYRHRAELLQIRQRLSAV